MNKNKKLSALKDLISKRRSRPQVAQPKSVQNKVEQPKVEAPKVEAPKAVEPVVEQPKVEEVAETPTAPIAETVEAEVKPKRRNRKNREVENG